jgi:hypothetical protein
MPGSVIYFSKESRAALKKQEEAATAARARADAALTSEQKEERERMRAELERKAEAALQAKVEEDAAGMIGRTVLKHHRRKHRAGTRRRSRGKTLRRK